MSETQQGPKEKAIHVRCNDEIYQRVMRLKDYHQFDNVAELVRHLITNEYEAIRRHAPDGEFPR